MAELGTVPLLITDDFSMRKLPLTAGSSALHTVGDSYLLLTRPSAHLSATVELRFQFRYAAPLEPRLLQLDPHVLCFPPPAWRRAQEGRTGACDQGSGPPRPTGAL